MSLKKQDSLSDSLSQGEDYLSLLNDSVTEKWNTRDRNPHRHDKMKSEVKETLNYLEDDVKHLGNEVIALRSHNSYLEAQIKVLEKEKEMHVSSHAKEKVKLESIIKDLQNRLQIEKKEFSKQKNYFQEKIQEMERIIQEEQSKRLSVTKKYKEKLENRETELLSLIKDKDKHIHQLQLQLQQGKCSRVCAYNPINATHKKSKSKKSIHIPMSKTYSESTTSKNESRMDNISDLIVKLEKEQADLNQTITELDYSSTNEGSKTRLREIMHKNEEKLKQAKNLQQSLLREKFCSE
jgi:DNA repair exonuclease SbcCD ATPase subunit